MSDFILQKRLIVAGLAALLLADGGFAYYNAKMSSNHQNPDQVLKEQNLRLATLKADVKRASDIRAHIPEVVQKFDAFEQELPPASKGYSAISQELDETAKDTRVLIEDEKFHQKEVTGRSLQELDIEAAINGDYSSIVSFLNRLQRSKNTYIVDSLQLESSGGANPTSTLKVTFHLRTLFRKG